MLAVALQVSPSVLRWNPDIAPLDDAVSSLGAVTAGIVANGLVHKDVLAKADEAAELACVLHLRALGLVVDEIDARDLARAVAAFAKSTPRALVSQMPKQATSSSPDYARPRASCWRFGQFRGGR